MHPDKILEIQKRYHKNLNNISSAIQDAGGAVNILSEDITLSKLLHICSMNNIEITTKHKHPEENTTKTVDDIFDKYDV